MLTERISFLSLFFFGDVCLVFPGLGRRRVHAKRPPRRSQGLAEFSERSGGARCERLRSPWRRRRPAPGPDARGAVEPAAEVSAARTERPSRRGRDTSAQKTDGHGRNRPAAPVKLRKSPIKPGVS
ncbi:hypothetical protein BS78_01G173000 [Paspalum vaginatum]|nr:hypothetical protein BS78_01G173000 [Paspalum vaginatum]